MTLAARKLIMSLLVLAALYDVGALGFLLIGGRLGF